MRNGCKGCICFSSIKSCTYKRCAVSLVRETLQVSLSMFWTRLSTNNFYKITQSSSFRFASSEQTNYNLLGGHVIIGHTIEETLMARKTVMLLLQKLEFVLNLKKYVLTLTKRTELLRVTLDSLFMTLSLPISTYLYQVSKVRKQCLELLQVSTLELAKTNRLIAFNYSSSTSSTNKFQVSTTTTNTSIKITWSYCKNAILKKTRKEEVQWRIKI